MLRTTSRMLVIAGGCALAILISALASAPAGAADLAVCDGTEQASSSPGVTFTARDVNAHVEDAFTCVAGDPGAASGHAADSFTWHGSCLDLPAAAGGYDLTLTWSDATTSTWSISGYTATVVAGQLIFTDTGSITAGKFVGATASGVVVDVAPTLLQCLGTGVTSMSGVLNFTIA
jgi:hypothetical protein